MYNEDEAIELVIRAVRRQSERGDVATLTGVYAAMPSRLRKKAIVGALLDRAVAEGRIRETDRQDGRADGVRGPSRAWTVAPPERTDRARLAGALRQLAAVIESAPPELLALVWRE